MIDIRVLGTLEIHPPNGGAPVVALTQPKRLALLLYLALSEPSGPKSRESLMALLWPEADDESARHSLRNALYGLRQTLGEATLISRGEGYVGLDLAALRLDALEVRRLLAEGKWEDAVVSWGGDLAPGFHVSGAPEFDLWLENQRTSLRRAVTEGAWRRVDELERSGDAGLVPAAQRAWALEPGNEVGARRLMRFLDASVGRASALRAYDDLADYLRRECEVEPSSGTQALAGELRSRIEPQVLRVPPALPASSALPMDAPYLAPSRQLTRHQRVRITIPLIVAAVLLAGVLSVFAFRLKSPVTQVSGSDPMARAEREGVLRLPARFRRDSVAYRSYLRGLAVQFQGNHIASRDTFAALVEQEPLYAPGLSGLAHAYILLVIDGSIPPAEGWPKVEAAAHKAIALDSAAASAYLALGAMEMFWRWDLPKASDLIGKALALDPDDPEAHAVRGVWFRWREELDSAVAEARVSYRLDPLTPQWSSRLGRQLYLARRYPEAEGVYRQTLRDYPERRGAYEGLFDVYSAMGRMRDALAMRRAGLEVEGDSAAAAQLPVAATDSEAARLLADRSRTEALEIGSGAHHGNFVPPNTFAYAYAKLQDRDETLRWLDSMRISRDPLIQNVLLNPAFDFLRTDGRYQAWEAKLTWRRPGVAPPVGTPAPAR